MRSEYRFWAGETRAPAGHLIQYTGRYGPELRPDSDLDLLLVISEGSWAEKDAVTEPGYLSSIGTSVIPSFLVLTRAEWTERERKKAPILQTITRDGLQVL
jgi:hypothetical protein